MKPYTNKIKSIFPQIDFGHFETVTYTDLFVIILEWLKLQEEKAKWKEIISQLIELKELSESVPHEKDAEENLHSVFLVILFEELFSHPSLRKLVPFLAPKSFLKENKEHILEGVSKKDFKATLNVYPKN